MKNALEDKCIVPGAGAFEVAAHAALTSAEFMNTVPGRAKFGVKVRGEGGEGEKWRGVGGEEVDGTVVALVCK